MVLKVITVCASWIYGKREHVCAIYPLEYACMYVRVSQYVRILAHVHVPHHQCYWPEANRKKTIKVSNNNSGPTLLGHMG
jgi:hypothetical protein